MDYPHLNFVDGELQLPVVEAVELDDENVENLRSVFLDPHLGQTCLAVPSVFQTSVSKSASHSSQ
jgi:hypothetical protein